MGSPKNSPPISNSHAASPMPPPNNFGAALAATGSSPTGMGWQRPGSVVPPPPAFSHPPAPPPPPSQMGWQQGQPPPGQGMGGGQQGQFNPFDFMDPTNAASGFMHQMSGSPLDPLGFGGSLASGLDMTKQFVPSPLPGVNMSGGGKKNAPPGAGPL